MTQEKKIEKEAKLIVGKYGKGSVSQKDGKKSVITFSYDDEYGTKRRKSLTINNGETPQEVKLNFIKEIIAKKYQVESNKPLSETVSNNSDETQQLLDKIQSLENIIVTLNNSKPAKCEKLFSEVAQEYYDEKVSSGFAYSYTLRLSSTVRKVNSYLGHIKISEVTNKDYQDFISKVRVLDNGGIASEGYMRTVNSVVLSILKLAKKRGYIDRYDNIVDVTMPRDIKEYNPDNRYYDYKQLAMYLFLFKDHYTYKLFTRLLVLTGMRSQELFAITIKDIDRKNHRIYVHQAAVRNKKENPSDSTFTIGKTKTKTSVRYVPAIDEVLNLIDEWLYYAESTGLRKKAIERGNGNLVFIDSEGGVVNRTNTHTFMRRYIEKQYKTDKHFGFHALRHCYATYLDREGANLRDISQSMGHSLTRGSVTDKHYISRDNSYIDRLLPYLVKINRVIDKELSVFESSYVNYLIEYNKRK